MKEWKCQNCNKIIINPEIDYMMENNQQACHWLENGKLCGLLKDYYENIKRVIQEKKEQPKSNKLESPSYMELRLDIPNRATALFLRVPTFWDSVKKQWIGVIKLKDGKLIHADGKNSFELQNNFNIVMHEYLTNPDYEDEIFSMFKSLEYWENI